MKRRFSLVPLVALLLAVLILSACGGSKETVTMLNNVSEFYDSSVRLEATARELTVSGSDASVRIRVTNRGEEEIDGFQTEVLFLDAEGNVLYTDEVAVQFEVPLEIGGSVSMTATCSGKDVKNIASVNVMAAG